MFDFGDLGIPEDEEKKRKKKTINPLAPSTSGGGVDPAIGLKRGSGGSGFSTMGGSTDTPVTTRKTTNPLAGLSGQSGSNPSTNLLDRLKPKKKTPINPGLGEVKTPNLSKTPDLTRSLTKQNPVRLDATRTQTQALTPPPQPRPEPKTTLEAIERGWEEMDDEPEFVADISKARTTQEAVDTTLDQLAAFNEAKAQRRGQEGGEKYLGHEFPNDPAGRRAAETLHKIRHGGVHPEVLQSEELPSETRTSITEEDIERGERIYELAEMDISSPEALKKSTRLANPETQIKDLERVADLTLKEGAPNEMRWKLGYLPDDATTEQKATLTQEEYDKIHGEGRYTVSHDPEYDGLIVTNNVTGEESPLDEYGFSLTDIREDLPNLSVWLGGKAGSLAGTAAGSLAGPGAAALGSALGNTQSTFLGEVLKLVNGRKKGIHEMSNDEILASAAKKAGVSGAKSGIMTSILTSVLKK